MDEGIRTSKTVNGVTTTYYLSGSTIISEETEGNITVYLYDSTGSTIGMEYHFLSHYFASFNMSYNKSSGDENDYHTTGQWGLSHLGVTK